MLIGKDTRRSGYMLEDALAAGLCSMGVDVLQVGPIPTPGLAFLTVDMRCDAGAMITASHNPFEDNGVKFFSRDGFKLPDEAEARIEALMGSPELERARALGADIGSARRIDDALGALHRLPEEDAFRAQQTLEGLRIAIDCANGAAYKVAPTVLEELGAEVVAVGNQPNGTNINEGCGATHPEHVAAVARQYRADVGIAVDGDADRVILVDERGEIVDGDQILAMCALEHEAARALLARRGRRHGDEQPRPRARARGAWGSRLVRADVGDRYVVEAMLREKINLGGEQSGHVIFLDHNTTGDGMLIGAAGAGADAPRGATAVGARARSMQRTPQVLRSVRVREQAAARRAPELARAVDARRARRSHGRGRDQRALLGHRAARARDDRRRRRGARSSALADELCDAIRKAIGEDGQ